MKMRDIAREAGVSLTTVSLVLNGKTGVSPEKRSVIQRLLAENGYQLQSSDQQPPAPAGKSICFLKYSKHSYLVNGNPGFVTQIMDSAEQECRKNGYDLLVVTCSDLTGFPLADVLEKQSVKGILLLGTELDDAGAAVFEGFPKPVVAVDNGLPLISCSSVTMDNRRSILAAVEHLKSLGHRKIGFLYNSLPSNNDRARRRAFEDALSFFGLPFDPSLVYSVFPTMDGARKSVAELLEKGARFPPALLANNDSIAIGAIQSFKDYGLQIPEDISIMGFDGLPFSAVSDPPLTTISVPCQEIGCWAVRILLDTISEHSAQVCKMLVGTSLLKRSSTAPSHEPRRHPLLLP